MAKDLLLEIGTEEIPSRFMAGTLEQMAKLAEEQMAANRLSYQKVSTYGTPRRLALYVSGLAAVQGELVEEIKGPPVRTAYGEDGRPTKAALGFAASQGVKVDDLVVRNFKGGEYVFALKREGGKPVREVLPGILSIIVKSLFFPRPMRWGELDMRFVRPIRWLLTLYGDEAIPFELAGLTADRVTRGHRFLSPGLHVVDEASAYLRVLEKNYVIADQDRRRRLIWEQVMSLAASKGGRVKEDPDLLEEITYLVEYPGSIMGSFEPDYLKLPIEVVVTPMRDHQRYFPVWDDGEKLLPMFIAVSNGIGIHENIVSQGYERVLAARLEDASFFFREDKKTSLEAKVDRLEEIVFQERLGTMLAKTRRLERLAIACTRYLDLPQKLLPAVQRTARLAKADLVTAMVFEFPELQGIMGSHYAAADGEAQEVCRGIRQHYWPRYQGDSLPDSLTGMVVGLADRIDTLVGYFGAGLIPTGSQDPYALRRQAAGLVTIAVELNLRFSLAEFIAAAYEEYSNQEIELTGSLSFVQEQLIQFCRQRLEYILEEKGMRFDVIQAVLAVESDDLAGIYQRGRDLSLFRQEEGFEALQTAFTRAFNLARQANERLILYPGLMQEKVEIDLFRALENIRGEAQPLIKTDNYLAALKVMSGLQGPIDRLFDEVLVMAPDMNIRNNRLALLQEVVALVFQVADFSRLVAK